MDNVLVLCLTKIYESTRSTHLAHCLHPLEEDEKDDEPGEEEENCQLPVDVTHSIEVRSHLQDLVTGNYTVNTTV